jgi:hypothetical protein
MPESEWERTAKKLKAAPAPDLMMREFAAGNGIRNVSSDPHLHP